MLDWGSSAVVVARSLARCEGNLVRVGPRVVELDSGDMALVEWSVLVEIYSRPYLCFEMEGTVVVEKNLARNLYHLPRQRLVMKMNCVIGDELCLLRAGQEQMPFVVDRV